MSNLKNSYYMQLLWVVLRLEDNQIDQHTTAKFRPRKLDIEPQNKHLQKSPKPISISISSFSTRFFQVASKSPGWISCIQDVKYRTTQGQSKASPVTQRNDSKVLYLAIYKWYIPPFGCFQKIVGFPPKSSILIGFSIIFTIHFGVPLFLETPIWVYNGVYHRSHQQKGNQKQRLMGCKHLETLREIQSRVIFISN